MAQIIYDIWSLVLIPVVSGESLPLLVRVRADEASEEELQEGDGSPEEVGDGT